MAIAELTSAGWTLSDLAEKFGPMPAARIRSQPPPGTATEDDALRILEQEKRPCELVDGVLVEKTMGLLESMIALRLASRLDQFVVEHNLGVMAGEAGTLRLAPGQIRIPDVCFISWHRLAGRDPFRLEPIPDVIPNLAIEVLSPGNTVAEMSRKLADYFAAGVELVWYLDPRKGTATVYQSPDSMVVLSGDAVLDGGEVLPDFSVSVADLFRVGQPPSSLQ